MSELPLVCIAYNLKAMFLLSVYAGFLSFVKTNVVFTCLFFSVMELSIET